MRSYVCGSHIFSPDIVKMLSQIGSDEQVNPWEISLLLGYLKEKKNNRKDACIFKVTLQNHNYFHYQGIFRSFWTPTRLRRERASRLHSPVTGHMRQRWWKTGLALPRVQRSDSGLKRCTELGTSVSWSTTQDKWVFNYVWIVIKAFTF